MNALSRRGIGKLQLALWLAVFVVLVANKLFLPEIMDFILAGKVPGTDIVLSPDVVVTLSLGTAICILLASGLHFLLSSGYKDAYIPDRPIAGQPAAALVHPAFPATYDRPVQVSALPYHNETATIQFHIACMRGVGRAREVYDEVALRQQKKAYVYGWKLSHVAADIKEFLWDATDRLMVCLEILLEFIGSTWQTADPHLRKLDAWLERQVKLMQQQAMARIRRSETAYLVSEALIEPLRSFRSIMQR